MQRSRRVNFTQLHTSSHALCEVSRSAKSIYINIYDIIYITTSPVHEGRTPETCIRGDRREVVKLGSCSLPHAPEALKYQSHPVKVHKLHGGTEIVRWSDTNGGELHLSTQQSPRGESTDKLVITVDGDRYSPFGETWILFEGHA